MGNNLIVSDPDIMMGKPVVSGTRLTVELILVKLAAGETRAQMLAAHPRLTREGVQAALAYAAQTMALVRERGKTLVELAEKTAFFFKDDIAIDEKAASQWLKKENLETLGMLREKLSSLDDFGEEELSNLFGSMVEETGTKMKKIAQPVRVALTGTTASPGIFETMTILGKANVLKRLDAAIAKGPSDG